MNDRSDAEALATARNQTEAMRMLAAEVKRLRTYGKRNRKFVLFDIVLTVALAVVTFVAVHASESAHTASVAAEVATENSRALCESSNIARAQSIELWDYLLALPPAKGAAPPSAQQKERVAEFRAFLDKVYQPRNCAHVSPGNP